MNQSSSTRRSAWAILFIRYGKDGGAWLAQSWRTNPGFVVAGVSGTLALALAVWLLLQSIGDRFFSPISEPQSVSNSLSEDEILQQELGTEPQDESDQTLRIDLQVRTAGTDVPTTDVEEQPTPEENDQIHEPVDDVVPPLRLVETSENDDQTWLSEDDERSETPITDDESPIVKQVEEPTEEPSEPLVVDLRLTEPALNPEIASEDLVADLLPVEPTTEVVDDEIESNITIAENEPDPNEWKPAPPLPAPATTRESVETTPTVTEVIVEPASPPQKTVPTPPPPPVVSRPAPKLKLEWESHAPALIGKSVKIHLTVSNVGNAVARNVELNLRLPQKVGHPEGLDLEQAIGDLAVGESRVIPLIITPDTLGEVELPVRATAGETSSKSTGVLEVRRSIADAERKPTR